MKRWNFVKEILFSEEQVDRAICYLIKDIYGYYKSLLSNKRDLQMIIVQNGGENIGYRIIGGFPEFLVTAMRILTSSYSGMKQMEDISVSFSEEGSEDHFRKKIKGKHILIIDDILDSGRTLDTVKKEVEKYEPKDVQFCVMISRNRERNFDIKPKFVALNLDGDDFVVGCGLDLDGRFRELPYIASIKKEKDDYWDPENRSVKELCLCNHCGQSCITAHSKNVGNGDNDFYGLIDAKVRGFYFSEYLDDGVEYRFDLCERCLRGLFDTFTIPVIQKEYDIASGRVHEDR